MRSVIVSVVFSLLIVILCGCSAHVDRGSVRAQAGSPMSSQVEEVSIPYQSGRPVFVVSVEPFDFIPEAYQNDQTLRIRLQTGGKQLQAKLVSTLTGVGNISVLDARGLRRRSDGTYSTRLAKGERGPYLIKATITEFAERAAQSQGSKNLSLGWVGIVAGVAGAIADKPGLLWPGVGVAAANPGFRDARDRKTGMVAIDVQVVDGRTMRVVSAFRSSGTFFSEESRSGWSLFGYADSSAEFAQSVLGQATQVALNDAARRLARELH